MALAIIMLPLIARSTQEVLRLVPATLREAADALGVDRWRAILTVILPTALGGILTGSILAIARAAGETAPLLVDDSTFGPHVTFNWFGPMPNIPVSILTASERSNPAGLPARLGRRTGAAGAYPDRKHRRAGCCWPAAAGEMTG